MWTAIASIGSSIASFIATWTGPVVGYFVGKKSAERTYQKREMEGIKDASDAKRRVDTDSDYRKRLRERFGGK